MKIFDAFYSFFESIREYIKNFSNLFFIFLGAFLAVSVVVIIITSFAYECQLTKTIDKINKFLERNPRINDDNLVAFNNLMKAGNVPKTLRRQWQQFMLYREHPASYYMSFQHCVENPMRNSTYRQQMTVYKVISYVLVVLSLVTSTFMATNSYSSALAWQEMLIIPITILVLYWLVSMVLDLIHSAISGDLFQNYQYFEINMDKAMLTLPEFVDYEVLFSQDEIRRGIPVLFAYLQKRAIQEQQELEKARLKSVDHEKFDFDKAGLDGSLVLDRAMRETENFTSQRKKYMQETERVNNEIAVLENNYKEQIKEYQRQVQTSKETVENLKEQLDQATSTIEINYIKKQMRDEINRQQLAEKDFDILTDKHNQEIKSLNQEIKHYEEETKKAKEALEVAMLSEFNTYSIKVYDNLEKIVDEKMQDKVDDYKDQIKGLEGQLEEKNEELENVYTRYQEALSQVPAEPQMEIDPENIEPQTKKGKKKKKNSESNEGMVQPERVDEQLEYANEDYDQYDNNQAYEEYQGYDTYSDNQDYNYDYNDYSNESDTALNVEYSNNGDEQYVPIDREDYNATEQEYVPQYDYSQEDSDEGYVPLNEEYVPLNEEYIPLNEEYVPLNEEYVVEGGQGDTYLNDSYLNTETVNVESNEDKNVERDNIEGLLNSDYLVEDETFDDSDFDIDFNNAENGESDADISFDLLTEDDDVDEEPKQPVIETIEEEVEGDFDINKVLGLYENEPETTEKEVEKDVEPETVENKEIDDDDSETAENNSEELIESEELPAPEAPRRKAGRPRKQVDSSEVAPKRKVGRPRKVIDENEIATPKRKVGRPKKVVTESEILEKPKKRVGRPRKQFVEIKEKRKVGRPRKEDKQVLVKKSRKVGRPRKVVANTMTLAKPKNKVGRPKKIKQARDLKITRKVGRPRKQVVEATKKRKVGRPRKIK